MKRLLCIAWTAVALFGFTACSNATSNKIEKIAQNAAQPAGPSPDPTSVIQRYVAAEDNDFGDLQGDPVNRSSGDYDYFGATQSIPGASNCVVYIYKKSNDHFANCDFNAANLAKAKALYQAWMNNVQSAEPYWKTIEVTSLPNGDVAATLFSDSKEQHGVYVSIAKDAQNRYRITMLFAKMATLRS